MTDIDTSTPAVHELGRRHPAGGSGSCSTTRDQRSEVEPSIDDGATIVPLNDAAAIYEALAEQIAGTAVGWSDDALAKLERGLLQRYGPVVGGRHPVRRLVRLAARPIGR